LIAETFHIETFGCQMNRGDSDIMTESFLNEGFVPAKTPETADILVYNTCSVRQHAEERVLARINSCKKSVRGHEGIIVVTGCMAQRVGKELIENSTADLIIGPYQSPKIGVVIKEFLADRKMNAFISQDPENFTQRISVTNPGISEERSWHRWITITHGCVNFCSYCIVPSVRGPLISFKSSEIMDHIERLAGEGIREITLLGQNVNQYGSDTGDIPFSKLLEKAAAVKGLVRVNFITSHPKDFERDTVKVIRDNPVISRSIHLPLQSGSDNILTRMNRKYDMKQYRGLVEMIGEELNEYGLTTDLIVGYPGETEEDYNETLRSVERIQFDDAFMYAYSPREGTPAFREKEMLTREEKIERLNRLIALQRKISRKKLEDRIDSIDKMIVERISKKSDNEVMGKTFLNHPAVLPGSAADMGKSFEIRIKGVRGSTLQGERIA
jgi:tRNA-2-methylthio-N6-dimethylallyladenosine synthase